MKLYEGSFVQHRCEVSHCFGKCYLTQTKFAGFASFQKNFVVLLKLCVVRQSVESPLDFCILKMKLHIGNFPITLPVTIIVLSRGPYLISQRKLQARDL